VTLPAYWASALVNGDYSGLDDGEAAHVEKIISDLASDGWYVVDVKRNDDSEAEEARFTWCYQLYNAYGDARGGDVLDYIVHCEAAS
jgi:hypothetical protein